MEDQKITQELEQLRSEHRDLDDLIKFMEKDPQACRFTIMRHKKRKLQIKDQVLYLESFLYPDLIA